MTPATANQSKMRYWYTPGVLNQEPTVVWSGPEQSGPAVTSVPSSRTTHSLLRTLGRPVW